ncbi:eukaryotic translation initiation factor 3 subunit L isoform X1 [Lates japonicus]|uniref:Eukaryotic translation initiation factor 3 subunit L isoform X1 n=1 Tax=Lates japonicus TaxID=270547 RepID=A0AAD3NMC7_LATJO|nr:eukaryotic translation initiation factor 3 subunit L isoform X1 [Lates japonicus]
MFQRSTYKYEMINKQSEQICMVCCIALTMYPMRVSEHPHPANEGRTVQNRLSEFLSPVVPNYDNVPNYHKEPFQQLKVFAEENAATARSPPSAVHHHASSQAGRIPGHDRPRSSYSAARSSKHKMKNLVWTSGISALDGGSVSSGVDFYIDKGTLRQCPRHVAVHEVDSTTRAALRSIQPRQFKRLQKGTCRPLVVSTELVRVRRYRCRAPRTAQLTGLWQAQKSTSAFFGCRPQVNASRLLWSAVEGGG